MYVCCNFFQMFPWIFGFNRLIWGHTSANTRCTPSIWCKKNYNGLQKVCINILVHIENTSIVLLTGMSRETYDRLSNQRTKSDLKILTLVQINGARASLSMGVTSCSFPSQALIVLKQNWAKAYQVNYNKKLRELKFRKFPYLNGYKSDHKINLTRLVGVYGWSNYRKNYRFSSVSSPCGLTMLGLTEASSKYG